MKTGKFFRSILWILSAVILFGCAHTGPDRQAIEARGEAFTTLSRSRAVEVVAEPYVGVKAVPIRADAHVHAAFDTPVTLRIRGTLTGIAAAVSKLTPLTVQVGADPAPLASAGQGNAGQQGQAAPDEKDLPALLSVPGSPCLPFHMKGRSGAC